MNDVLARFAPLLNTPEPPALGPEQRASTWPLETLQTRLGQALTGLRLPEETAHSLRSLVLLWHDHLDASHELSQNLSSAEGSFLHGLMHRREPDFGNAAYWFRQVGEHSVYPRLAETLAGWPDGPELQDRLIAGGRWRPLAMIDACEAVEVGAAESGDAGFLRRVQALEFRFLLEKLCAG